MKPTRIASLLVVLVAGTLLCVSAAPAARSVPGGAAAVSPFLPTPPLAGPRQLVFYGHAKTLVRRAGHWELGVDPAEFLSGRTATRAAVADGAIAPGDAVPNDYYIRDEGHRLLTYRMTPGTPIRMVAPTLKTTRIPVSELARVLAGKKTRHRLFEPLAGFWIRVAGDTVKAMDQQYQP